MGNVGLEGGGDGGNLAVLATILLTEYRQRPAVVENVVKFLKRQDEDFLSDFASCLAAAVERQGIDDYFRAVPLVKRALADHGIALEPDRPGTLQGV